MRVWESSRGALQPLFTAKRAETLVDKMAEAINEAVDEWLEPALAGRPIDGGAELTQIVLRTTMRVLFADRISVPDALRISAALDTVTTAMLPRLLMPAVPYAVPMPGDRRFREAVRTIDEVVLPIIREARARPTDGDDIISTLCRPRADGSEPDEYAIRGDVVAMFSTATETTIALLSWLWPVLASRPDVAERMTDEIEQVVGAERVGREHLPQLRYGRMVLDEMLRLYPAGWMIPRTAVGDDVLGGVRIKAGGTVLVSPYVTQRMSTFWDDPALFDPERFAPELPRRRYRYSYFPFGGGPHQCLGQYLFLLEAQLIVSTVLSRYRFRLREPADLHASDGRLAATEAARRGHPHPGRASGRIVTETPRPARAGQDAVAEQGRVCALAVRGVRDLQDVTAAHPELFDAAPFDPALLSSVATAIAFTAPWHTAAELRITTRTLLWVFAADWQVDYLARSVDDVRKVVTDCLAVADGAAPPPGATSPGCWPTCATNWPPCRRSPGCARSGATSWRGCSPPWRGSGTGRTCRPTRPPGGACRTWTATWTTRTTSPAHSSTSPTGSPPATRRPSPS